jgi:membrane-associated phospholipid phosphatase
MTVAEWDCFNFSLQAAQGILTVPFVHAAVACLCAWAAWTSPMRHPFLILNIATAVSALLHGSHYLVDVIAGLGVSAFAIATITFFAGSVAPSQREIRMVRT